MAALRHQNPPKTIASDKGMLTTDAKEFSGGIAVSMSLVDMGDAPAHSPAPVPGLPAS